MEKVRISTKIKPPTQDGRGRPARWPWKTLGVGESFFIASQHTRPHISYWAKVTGNVFVSRRTNANGRDGWRVWRVS